MTIDRAEIRRRALIARDQAEQATAAVRLTPSQVDLVLALDPSTVLELLDEAKVERASFESACDAAQELDARLARLIERWRGMSAMSCAHRCASELEALLKERR